MSSVHYWLIIGNVMLASALSTVYGGTWILWAYGTLCMLIALFLQNNEGRNRA